MAYLVSQSKVLGGIYDFSNDSGLGAIGTVNLGVFLPQNSIIKRFFVKPINVPTSLGSATLSFVLAGAVNTNTLMVVTAIAAFGTQVVRLGVDFNANPFNTIEQGSQVKMLIATAALTAGKLEFQIEYNENDI